MNGITTRALSGAVYIAVIVACVLAGLPGLSLLAGIFAILAGSELTRLIVGLNSSRNLILILDLAGLLLLSYGPSAHLALIWIAVIILRLVAQLYSKETDPIRSLGCSMLLQVYLGLPLFLMVTTGWFAARSPLWSSNMVLAVFIFLWLNDTGAYLVGSKFGKRRLFERISPKKSWEGFFGGWIFNIILSVIFSLYCSRFFGMPSDVLIWIGLATVVTLFGTWGDLVESLIKRALGTKDSGHLIPGHGGILDRIDSFLLAMPASFVYIALCVSCPFTF